MSWKGIVGFEISAWSVKPCFYVTWTLMAVLSKCPPPPPPKKKKKKKKKLRHVCCLSAAVNFNHIERIFFKNDLSNFNIILSWILPPSFERSQTFHLCANHFDIIRIIEYELKIKKCSYAFKIKTEFAMS